LVLECIEHEILEECVVEWEMTVCRCMPERDMTTMVGEDAQHKRNGHSGVSLGC